MNFCQFPQVIQFLIENYIFPLEEMYRVGWRMKLITPEQISVYHVRCARTANEIETLKGTRVIYDYHFAWKDLSSWKVCKCNLLGPQIFVQALATEFFVEAQTLAMVSEAIFIS
jgi:hypothetical protein